MAIRGLGEYLALKYANNKVVANELFDDSLPDPLAPKNYKEIIGHGDNSLGVTIPADMVQRYKDKLISVYDRIKEELTQLPFFKQLYLDMKGEPVLMVFNNIIEGYVVNIANAATLKEAFMYGIKYVDSFNKLRDSLPGMIRDKEKMHRIDDAIYNTQMYLWPRLKAMLNIHDIGSDLIPLDEKDAEEMKIILKQIPSGTWHYGHLKNPTKATFRKNVGTTPNRIIKRLEDEATKDEIRNRLGPYSTESEVEDEFEKLKELDKKQRQQASKTKHNQSLTGKEKNKLR